MDREKIRKPNDRFEDKRPKIGCLHWNRLSFDQLLFAIIIITSIACGNRVDSFGTLTDCSAYTTCTTCTSAPCSWNSRDQACGVATNLTSILSVTKTSFCPRFTVQYSNSDKNLTQVKVTIADDQKAYAVLLDNKNVLCHLNDIDSNIVVMATVGQIVCSPKNHSNFPEFPDVWYLSITIDNRSLRFDKVSDHYVTDYPSADVKNCRGNRSQCLESYWDDDRYRYYCAWCPRDYPCSGSRALRHCDIRKLPDYSKAEPPADVVIGGASPAAWIEWHEPTNKPRDGDATTVRFTVHNHGLMAGDGTSGPTVTVTGCQCNVTETKENGDITCAVTWKCSADGQQSDHKLAAVTYPGSPNVIVQLDRWPFESSTTNLTAKKEARTYGGIASGGTTICVRGVRFTSIQKAWINVTTVGQKSSVSDEACKIFNDTYMECKTPAIDVTNMTVRELPFGILVHLKNNRTKTMLKTSVNYHVYPDPDFVDFTVDGCCNVTVYGPDLRNLGDRPTEDVSVRSAGDDRRCEVNAVRANAIECWLPQTTSSSSSWPQQIAVTVGHLTANVTRRNTSIAEFSSLKTANILPGVLTITAYVSCIVFLTIVLVALKTSTNAYDLLLFQRRRSRQPEEVQSLDENNSNSGGDGHTGDAAPGESV